MRRRMTRDVAASLLFSALMMVLVIMIDDRYVILVGTFLTFSALAVTLDLMLGTTGLLAIGHASFFALGGYGTVV